MKPSLGRPLLLVLGTTFLVLAMTLLARQEAAAATTADDCAASGGSWAGPDDYIGTCTYPANSTYAISNCGANRSFAEAFNPDESITGSCTLAAPTPNNGNSQPAYGGCRNEVRGPLTEPVKLSLCNHKNGTVTFPVGGCELKCTITQSIPKNIARKLPRGAAATIYVRLVDQGGLPGNHGYTVCFSLADLTLKPPAIFQYREGSWQAIAIGNADNDFICAVAAADGSFFLGEFEQN